MENRDDLSTDAQDAYPTVRELRAPCLSIVKTDVPLPDYTRRINADDVIGSEADYGDFFAGNNGQAVIYAAAKEVPATGLVQSRNVGDDPTSRSAAVFAHAHRTALLAMRCPTFTGNNVHRIVGVTLNMYPYSVFAVEHDAAQEEATVFPLFGPVTCIGGDQVDALREKLQPAYSDRALPGYQLPQRQPTTEAGQRLDTTFGMLFLARGHATLDGMYRRDDSVGFSDQDDADVYAYAGSDSDNDDEDSGNRNSTDVPASMPVTRSLGRSPIISVCAFDERHIAFIDYYFRLYVMAIDSVEVSYPVYIGAFLPKPRRAVVKNGVSLQCIGDRMLQLTVAYDVSSSSARADAEEIEVYRVENVIPVVLFNTRGTVSPGAIGFAKERCAAYLDFASDQARALGGRVASFAPYNVLAPTPFGSLDASVESGEERSLRDSEADLDDEDSDDALYRPATVADTIRTFIFTGQVILPRDAVFKPSTLTEYMTALVLCDWYLAGLGFGAAADAVRYLRHAAITRIQATPFYFEELTSSASGTLAVLNERVQEQARVAPVASVTIGARVGSNLNARTYPTALKGAALLAYALLPEGSPLDWPVSYDDSASCKDMSQALAAQWKSYRLDFDGPALTRRVNELARAGYVVLRFDSGENDVAEFNKGAERRYTRHAVPAWALRQRWGCRADIDQLNLATTLDAETFELLVASLLVNVCPLGYVPRDLDRAKAIVNSRLAAFYQQPAPFILCDVSPFTSAFPEFPSWLSYAACDKCARDAVAMDFPVTWTLASMTRTRLALYVSLQRVARAAVALPSTVSIVYYVVSTAMDVWQKMFADAVASGQDAPTAEIASHFLHCALQFTQNLVDPAMSLFQTMYDKMDDLAVNVTSERGPLSADMPDGSTYVKDAIEFACAEPSRLVYVLLQLSAPVERMDTTGTLPRFATNGISVYEETRGRKRRA